MRKNLLLLVPSLASGGQEKVVVRTADILANDYNIIIAVFNSKKNKYRTNCRVIDVNLPASKNYLGKLINVVLRCLAIRKLIKENKIDITISYGTSANIINALCLTNEKKYLSIRGYESLSKAFVSRIFWRYLYAKADGIISVSKKISLETRRIYSISKEKVFTLYNPYDYEDFQKQSKEKISLELLGPTIISVGRITSVKGYHHLLNALNIALKDIPSLKLLLVGEGELKSELKEYSKELEIEDHVVFAGFQNNPYSFIEKCDLYVLSSINEGFPNALVEAMSCGVPAIATDCNTGPREIFTNEFEDRVADSIEYGEFGVLIPPFISDDSNEPEKDTILAKAIVSILNDKKRYVYYQNKSKERAKSFSIERFRSSLIKIIDG